MVGCLLCHIFAACLRATSSAHQVVRQDLEYPGVISSLVCWKQTTLVSVIHFTKLL